MKVGILSMHRVENYGSFWQAYLLKKFVTDAGCTVEFIDIMPGEQVVSGSRRTMNLDRIRRLPNRLFLLPKRRKIFAEVQEKELGCPPFPNYSTDYDCIIIGSDEVFNFAQVSSWGVSLQLHGKIDHESVHSYAASFGGSTFEDVEKFNLKEALVDASNNLKNISVRDDNSFQIMSKLLPERKIERHLDPVLVGDLPIPKPSRVKHPYILIYAYDYRFNDKEYIKQIRTFAEKNNYKVYAAGFYQTWVDKNFNASPAELLEFFANAEYVVTDTFHGTIFSVRCHKQFVTIMRDKPRSNRQKLTSLLTGLTLKNRVLDSPDDLESKITAPIDYIPVEELLSAERKRTIDYLNRCLYEGGNVPG